MKFIDCDNIKSSMSTIEISRDGKTFDLHNDAEFIGLSYNVKDRTLILNWIYYDEFGSQPTTHKLHIELINVILFEIKKRDVEMPYSEDDCLSGIIYNDSDEYIVFNFMGGQEIVIYSGELRFYLE